MASTDSPPPNPAPNAAPNAAPGPTASDAASAKAALAKGWQALEAAPADAGREAESVLNTDPANPEASLLLAAAHRRQGNAGAARRQLEPFMTPRMLSPVAWFEWGQILATTGDDAAAVEALRRAVTLAPAFTGAWRALGDQLLALGNAEAAGPAYANGARSSVTNPALAAAAAALAEGRMAEAEAALKAHVRLNPSDPHALWLLAEAAMRAGRVVEAEAVLIQCLTRAPGFGDARHALATLLYLQHRFAEAAAHMKRLLDMVPHQPALWVLFATCLSRVGDHRGAAAVFEKMLAAYPDRHSILLVHGHSLKALGREAEAAQAYRRALAIVPAWAPSLYLSLADLKTAPLTDADLAAMRTPSTTVSDFGKAQLGYAIGHALDQRGDYAAAFAAFADGAALRRATAGYDAAQTTAFVEAVKSTFTADFLAGRIGSGSPSDAPIFILGLPRAGSTLVEQILASHSTVEGTSELKEIGNFAQSLLAGRPATDLPAIAAAIAPENLAAIGARYLTATAQYRRLGRPHFTDKMPGNLLHIGLIHLILPNARIIDVRRDPMASGFAAFRQFFQLDQTGADFTWDLTDIGRYYRDYLDLTAHFDEVLPGRILHLRYEDLVEDSEAQIRALLDHCSLPFEPACLRYWETDRAVETPSAQQVRQPISREGLDHWRHYEPWLGPLEAALAG